MKCSGKKCCPSTKIAAILILIGALNWGLVGIFSFDLVAWIFGNMTPVARIIYTLVGISALYKIMMCKSSCKKSCGSSCSDKACEVEAEEEKSEETPAEEMKEEEKEEEKKEESAE